MKTENDQQINPIRENILAKEIIKNYFLSHKGFEHAERELERLRKYATDTNQMDLFLNAIEIAESEIVLPTQYKPDVETINHGFRGLSSDLRTRILEYFPSSPGMQAKFDDDLFDKIGISENDLIVCDVVGDSMTGAGIKNNDLLLANSFELPQDGKIVIAEINDKLYVKRYKVKDGIVHLISENPQYEPIIINSNQKFSIKGVVKHIISKINFE